MKITFWRLIETYLHKHGFNKSMCVLGGGNDNNILTTVLVVQLSQTLVGASPEFHQTPKSAKFPHVSHTACGFHEAGPHVILPVLQNNPNLKNWKKKKKKKNLIKKTEIK